MHDELEEEIHQAAKGRRGEVRTGMASSDEARQCMEGGMMTNDDIALSQQHEIELRLQQAQLLLKHSQELDKTKARIRELEEQLKDAGWEDHQRIAKAKAILKDNTRPWDRINDALDALEGK